MPSAVPELDDATLGQLNLLEYTREDARWQSPHEIVERDGILLFTGSSDFPAFCNGVRRVDDAVPGADVVAAAQEFFASRNRGFSLWTRDLPVDTDLAVAATAAGSAIRRRCTADDLSRSSDAARSPAWRHPRAHYHS